MPEYDANRPQQARINFFDLAGQITNLFEHEPLNAFDSIDAILSEPEEPLEEYFWDEPRTVSPWNSYWTEAAKQGGGLKIDDPVFKDFWTKYHGLHVNCWEEEICFCEHNCGGTHSTIGRAAGAQSEDSQATIKPTTKAPTSVFSWTDYNERRTKHKGKEVDQVQNPGPRPTPLVIITTPSGRDIFHW